MALICKICIKYCCRRKLILDIYAEITNKIVNALKNGTKPWRKPWQGASLAYNKVSKRKYSLLNQMLLKNTGEYASYKQWTDLGFTIRKGAVAEKVVFWKMLKFEDDDCERTVPFLRYHNVFHESQIVEMEGRDVNRQYTEVLPIDSADSLIQSYTDREHVVMQKGAAASYSPITDTIMFPELNKFDSSEEFYSTVFHEIIHSTGSKERLNRDLKSWIQSRKSYGKEELIAEIGATVLMETLGIQTDDCKENSVAYLSNWAEVISADKKLIVSAASKADTAVSFVLNVNK